MKLLRIGILILVFVLLLCGCTHAQWIPTEGVWYCEELQIQLACRDTAADTYAIVDGRQIICAWGANPGAAVFGVYCQEPGIPGCPLGKELFAGEYISLDDEEFVVQEYRGNNIYTFKRIS